MFFIAIFSNIGTVLGVFKATFKLDDSRSIYRMQKSYYIMVIV